MISVTANSQTIKGKITSKNEVVPFANIIIEGTKVVGGKVSDLRAALQW